MAAEQTLFGEGELSPAPDSISRAAFDAWNEAAEKHGWAKAQFLTAGRPAALRRAVKDVGGLHAWRALLAKCGTSEFLCGRTASKDRRPFTFTVDWACKPANLIKIMEGQYFRDEQREQAARQSLSRQMAPENDWARWLRDYKGPRSFWLPRLGPRPEDPRCQAPPEMLAACRKRLGITVGSAPQEETREQRLASTVETYRKAGRYEDANRVERQLATLQGRPSVEVPAPDARDPDVVPEPRKRPLRRESLADEERRRRLARERLHEPPPPDPSEIPEAEYEMVEE